MGNVHSIIYDDLYLNNTTIPEDYFEKTLCVKELNLVKQLKEKDDYIKILEQNLENLNKKFCDISSNPSIITNEYLNDYEKSLFFSHWIKVDNINEIVQYTCRYLQQ